MILLVGKNITKAGSQLTENTVISSGTVDINGKGDKMNADEVQYKIFTKMLFELMDVGKSITFTGDVGGASMQVHMGGTVFCAPIARVHDIGNLLIEVCAQLPEVKND